MLIIADGGMVSCNVSNTMDAILLTRNTGFVDGVKLDVRMTYDNFLVLCKDDDLSKNTLAKGMVSKSNLDYIKKVKFPSHVFKYFIPTLQDILEKYDKGKIVVLELYPQNNNLLYCKKIFELLSHYPYKYIFLIDAKMENAINNAKLNLLGDIKLKKDVLFIDNSLNKLDNIKEDSIIITTNPMKIKNYLQIRQKM